MFAQGTRVRSTHISGTEALKGYRHSFVPRSVDMGGSGLRLYLGDSSMDYDRLVTVLGQVINDATTDESGASNDDNPHRRGLSLSRAASIAAVRVSRQTAMCASRSLRPPSRQQLRVAE